MVIFDFIFYRIAKYYYKKDKGDIFQAVLYISLIHGYLILAILAPIIWSLYPREVIAQHGKLAGKLSMIPSLIIIIFNYYHYKNKYAFLDEKWKDKYTPFQRKLQDILIAMAVLAPFVALLIGILTGGAVIVNN